MSERLRPFGVKVNISPQLMNLAPSHNWIADEVRTRAIGTLFPLRGPGGGHYVQVGEPRILGFPPGSDPDDPLNSNHCFVYIVTGRYVRPRKGT